MSAQMKKFFSYYKPYKAVLALDLFCTLLMAAASVALPMVVQHVLKTIIPLGIPKPLYLWGGAMVGLILIYMLAEMFMDYRGHLMGAMMERDMRRELYDHYLDLPLSFYDEQRPGQLMSRLTNDLLSLSELFHHGPEDLMLALLKFSGALFLLFSINPQLTWLVLLFMPILTGFVILFNRKLNQALKMGRTAIGDINSKVEDALSGIRVVKSFVNEDLERQRFSALNQRFLESRRQGYRSEAMYYSPFNALTQLMTAGVVVLGGMGILNAQMDLADLMAFVLLVGNFIEPIQRITNFSRLYQEGGTGFERFMEMLAFKPEEDRPSKEPVAVKGALTFENVDFHYESRPENVLTKLNLSIAAGEYVALAGPSGAGKSTLFSLIPRFYDITSGKITLDGRDTREIGLRELRQCIGIVWQEVYLYADTVLENIRYGQPSATREAAIAAAKEANAHEFIMALPQGYDTDIGPRGAKLSGGQRQRLSIARVFLKNPPILLLDEATSSLDNESEKAIQESLERLAHGRTTLVIAHRLSTIQKAQRILVLGPQGIVEQGTHQALLAQGGEYARLYNMQFEQ